MIPTETRLREDVLDNRKRSDVMGDKGDSVTLSSKLLKKIGKMAERTGQPTEDILIKAIEEFLRKEHHRNPIYLSAPVSALMKGLYEEDTTIEKIKKQGDFGLGTFNDLNGEMVMLDGIVYQLKTDGLTYSVDDSAQTPFACVTFFHPTTVEDVEQDLDDAGFKNLLERLLPSKNMFYAIRIDGYFSYIKVWSVHKQDNYRPIAEVRPMAFDFHDIEGTLVGFYTPQFISSLSMPGYHLHFLTADRRQGGHMFQCQPKKARISIQFVPELKLNLPNTLDYLTTDL